ncbi:hypothetical protein FHS57_000703 [Runella defluvii]|uniref:Uncharacterized protein n=1 Tax=Runella defluvii TaxID=370973 RepID=A0A7W5ZGF2_9BACT|nr:hypothetical protein [Runella defluvii]MBB3836721.1 hypothetical protein [Runella defluvii]
MNRKLIILMTILAALFGYKVVNYYLPSKTLNPYFETRKTGYTWLGYDIYEHKRFFSENIRFKYYFLDNHNYFILSLGPYSDLRKKKLKDIKVKSFHLYNEEYKQNYDDFDVGVFVMKVFDFNLLLGDTLKYYKKENNKILKQKFYDISVSDTLYYFVSEHPLESENYPFKEAYLVSESKGIISTLLVDESRSPIQVRFLRGNWNSALYKGKKVTIKYIVKKEDTPEVNEIDIKQLPVFKKECFW